MANDDHPDHDQQDEEPDYRFTLANERTFLAWVRTSLAFLAAGIAVRQLVPPFEIPAGRSILAAACILTSATLAAGGVLRWKSVQQAMRTNQPLPKSVLAPVLGVALVVVAFLCLILVLR